jgi:hypothetical protein
MKVAALQLEEVNSQCQGPEAERSVVCWREVRARSVDRGQRWEEALVCTTRLGYQEKKFGFASVCDRIAGLF